MTETTDVTGTLAELERKLRELERELTSLGRRRADADAPTPPAPSPTLGGAPPTRGASSPTPGGAPSSTPGVAPSSTPGGGRLVDEAIEPALPGQAERVAPSAATPPPRLQRPGGVPRTAEPAEQGEAPRPTEAQLAGLAELRRFRDRLERFAKELAVEYDTLLGRVMTGLFSTSQAPTAATPAMPAQSAPPRMTSAPGAASAPPTAPPAASPPLTAPPAAFAPPTAPPAASPPPMAPPAAPAPPSMQPPTPSAPPAAPTPVAPEVASPQPMPSQEESLFEGHVELGAGPFYDIGALSAFERRLASLPNVISASVRRFEASHAVVDVRLSGPVALVGELRRTTDTDFSVREVASGRILLTFDEA